MPVSSTLPVSFMGQIGPLGQTCPRCDHTLFLGAIACCYHNCEALIGSEACSFLCPSEAQIALGDIEDLVVSATDEIAEMRGSAVKSLTLFTSCLMSFLGIDLDGIAQSLEERGIVCLRRERCRILNADPFRGTYGSGGSLAHDECEQLIAHLGSQGTNDGEEGESAAAADKAVAAAGNGEGCKREEEALRCRADTGGLLVVAKEALDAQGELAGLGNGKPFAWVEGLCDEVSFARLERLSGASVVVGQGTWGAHLAAQGAERIGARCFVMPTTYDIDEIDRAYEEFSACVGEPLDASTFRSEAQRAVESALAACEGRSLSLNLMGIDRPWKLVHALLSYGFSLESLSVSAPFGLPGANPASDDTDDDDYCDTVCEFPHVEQLPAAEPPAMTGFMPPRRNEVNFPTSGFAMRRAAAMSGSDGSGGPGMRGGPGGPGMPGMRGGPGDPGMRGGPSGPGGPGMRGGSGGPGMSRAPAMPGRPGGMRPFGQAMRPGEDDIFPAHMGYGAVTECMKRIIAAASAPERSHFEQKDSIA